jgi:hypothetical protein
MCNNAEDYGCRIHCPARLRQVEVDNTASDELAFESAVGLMQIGRRSVAREWIGRGPTARQTGQWTHRANEREGEITTKSDSTRARTAGAWRLCLGGSVSTEVCARERSTSQGLPVDTGAKGGA